MISRLFMIVLVVLTASGTAIEAPRLQAPCEPIALHIVIAREGDDLLISDLLWNAGIPEGSSVRFYYGTAKPPVGSIIAPAEPSPEWAASLLCIAHKGGSWT